MISSIIPTIKTIKIFDGRMVEIEYNDDVLVTTKRVDEIFNLYDSVINRQRVLKLVIIGKQTRITSEASNYIAKINQARKNEVIAEAIVLHSFLQTITANIYIKFIKKFYPIKHFRSKKLAIEWLEAQYMKIENTSKVSV